MFLVMVNPLVYTYRNIFGDDDDDDRPIILGIGNIL